MAYLEYWSRDLPAVLGELQTSAAGLSSDEAARRLRELGANRLADDSRWSGWTLLMRQIASPFLGLLLVANVVSIVTAQWTDAAIVLVIVAALSLIHI